MTTLGKNVLDNHEYKALIENYLDIREQYTTLATAAQRLGVTEHLLGKVIVAYRNAGDERLRHGVRRLDNDYTELDTSGPAVANVKVHDWQKHKAARYIAGNVATSAGDLAQLLDMCGLTAQDGKS